MSFPNVRHTYQTLPVRADHAAGSSMVKDIPIYKRQNSFQNKRKHDSCSDLPKIDHENQNLVPIDKSPGTSSNKRKLSEGSMKTVKNLIRRYESVNSLDRPEIDFPDEFYYDIGQINQPKSDVLLENHRQIDKTSSSPILRNESSGDSDNHPLKSEVKDILEEAFTRLQNNHANAQKIFLKSHQEYMKRSLQQMEHLSNINLQTICKNFLDSILPKVKIVANEFEMLLETEFEDRKSKAISDNLQETPEGADSDYKQLKRSLDVVTKQVLRQKKVIAKLQEKIEEMK